MASDVLTQRKMKTKRGPKKFFFPSFLSEINTFSKGLHSHFFELNFHQFGYMSCHFTLPGGSMGHIYVLHILFRTNRCIRMGQDCHNL
jgi:hypothetical protein